VNTIHCARIADNLIDAEATLNKEAVMTETENSAAMHSVTKEDLERVLAVGNLLQTVLTPDELEALGRALQAQSNFPVEKSDNRMGEPNTS
jgi:hypothetical protein